MSANILLIEYEPRYIERVQTALESSGYQIEVTADLESAVERCAAYDPQVVIITSVAFYTWLQKKDRDGAKGLLAMRRNRARTMAQDEESCVVYGMPKVAYTSGAARVTLPPEQIAAWLCDAYRLDGASGHKGPAA